jgi:glycosyltransferase involved in cell wall biosynthesis
MIDVSVIIPCRIGERRVIDAIKSIYDQKISVEILVGIDGNDSNLKNEIENLMISNLSVIEYVKPIGTTKILNDLLIKSQGTYIARMDADDLSLPHRLEKQLLFMNANPTVVMHCANAFKRDGTRVIKSESHYLSGKDFLKGNPVIHPTAFFRNEYFKQNCLKYDEKWTRSQDYELWTRLIRSGSMFFCSEPVIKYSFNFKIRNYSRQYFYFNIAFAKNLIWCVFRGRTSYQRRDLVLALAKLVNSPVTYLKTIIWNVIND